MEKCHFSKSKCNELFLFKLFSDLNIQTCHNLRIYVGGSYTRSSDNSDTDYWEPFICVYDKKQMKGGHEISRSLLKKPNLVSPFFGNQKPLLGMRWNSYVNLNLDQFDINKVFVFMCCCDAPLICITDDGFYLISQVYNEVETLLIRNLVFVDCFNAHFVVCFRLEFIVDGWVIIPMRYVFNSNKNMNTSMKIIFSNNWVLPDDSVNQISLKDLDSSDEELLVENT